MRIVIGIHSLAAEGGMPSYAYTVADQLQRAGHDIYIFSGSEDGPTDRLAALGLRTISGAEALPEEIDVFFVQDQPSAFDLLAARPEVPQVFVWHSSLFDVNLTPQLPDVTRLVVQVTGRPLERPQSLAVKAPIVRLRQPIDLQQFTPIGAISATPRRAISISNYLDGERRAVLIEAFDRAGIELELFGGKEPAQSLRAQDDMNRADIVIGKGRVIMEAMACGRAAFVYDDFGFDGWVTPENFDALLETGVSGASTTKSATVEHVLRELAGYSQSMGEVNRDLAMATLGVSRHTGELIEAIEQVLADQLPQPANESASELARLSRVSWRHESEAFQLRTQLRVAAEEYEELRQRAEAEIAALDQTLAAIVDSRRWQLLNKLLAPIDRLRGRR
jgi:hypothetical protein